MFILRSLGRCCCLILNNAEKIYCEARRLAQMFLLSASLAGACCRFRVFPLLSAAKCHTTCWKFSNHCKSKPNWSERIYTDGEWFIFFAAQIRGSRFFRQASVPISDVSGVRLRQPGFLA